MESFVKTLLLVSLAILNLLNQGIEGKGGIQSSGAKVVDEREEVNVRKNATSSKNVLQYYINTPVAKLNASIIKAAKNTEQAEVDSINEAIKVAASQVLKLAKKKSGKGGNIMKIVNGQNASPGEWPWQALVRAGNGLCGGVLIHSCYVLTAKHCTNVDKSQITVTLGEHNRQLNEGNEQVKNVIKIIRHPSLDASLLLLDTAPTLNSFVSTISLSSVLPPTGTQVSVTGWGWMQSSTSSAASILQELNLPVADWNVCAAQLNPIFASVGASSLQLTDVCAGDPNGNYANACHGDSGGPLVWHDGTKWSLIGIVNRGAPGCPTSVDYAVYLSIPSIRNWILGYLPAAQAAGGARCNCLHKVTRHDGAQISTYYDGANCLIGPARQGCGGNQENKAFIYHNRYYESSSRAIDCPKGWFDTCNCFQRTIPTSVGNFIQNNKFYLTPDNPSGPNYCNILGTYDPVASACLVDTAPYGTNAFKWSGNWYTSAKPRCDSPFWFDLANCHWMVIPSNGFISGNSYYVPSTNGVCPQGTLQNGNCLLRSAPWGTNAFAWSGRWYHTPRRQCDDGQFDGANCLMMYPPLGATAFIWGTNWYYGWL